MTLFEATLRLVLAAMPFCVAFAAALRVKQSRSANRVIYGVALGLALYLAAICAPDILFTRDLGLHLPLMALLSVPIWAVLTSLLQMARRSGGYAWGDRYRHDAPPARIGRSTARSRPVLRHSFPAVARPRNIAPATAMPIFRTSRLQS